ncbi:MAG: HsmA family protein [Coriobacteriia bacterium]|nr:HsmA family protein [Coriobacteriia bacterium]
MPRELIVPAIIMSLAFVFYTTGVWAERAARDLKTWHVVMFWLGIVCDSVATEMMFRMLVANGGVSDWSHTLTGAAALGLMAVHAIWATWTRWRGSESARRGFHRYSVAVWAVWLIPYLGGMIAGIMRGSGGA